MNAEYLDDRFQGCGIMCNQHPAIKKTVYNNSFGKGIGIGYIYCNYYVYGIETHSNETSSASESQIFSWN